MPFDISTGQMPDDIQASMNELATRLEAADVNASGEQAMKAASRSMSHGSGNAKDFLTSVEQAQVTATQSLKVLTEASSVWETATGKLPLGQVAESMAHDAGAYALAGIAALPIDERYSSTLGDMSTFAQSWMESLSTQGGFSSSGDPSVEFGQFIDTGLDSIFASSMDGTPMAVAFGSINSVVQSISGKDISGWATEALLKVFGAMGMTAEAMKGISEAGGALTMVATMYANWVMSASADQDRECAEIANQMVRDEQRRRKLVFGPRAAVAPGISATKVAMTLGDGVHPMGRVEGLMFYRSLTGRVLRSLALGHVFTRQINNRTYASYGGGSGGDEDNDAAEDNMIEIATFYREASEFNGLRQERARWRVWAQDTGFFYKWGGANLTFASALDGGRSDAFALIEHVRALYRAKLIQYREIVLVAHHYTREHVDGYEGAGFNKDTLRWDRESSNGVNFVTDPFEANEICDDVSGAHSVYRSTLLANLVLSLIDR